MRKSRSLRGAVFGAVLSTLLTPFSAAAQHAGDMLIGSTAAGGGALTIAYDFATRILASPNVLPGFFSTTDPGFDAVATAGSGRFPLAAGTTVRMTLVAIDAGAQLQLDGTTLDGPGDGALIGTSPDLHTHPQWQLLLDEGAIGDFTISFRLTATGYADSETYQAVVTNVVDAAPATPTPNATATPRPTATPGSGRVCGDADGNGRVTVSDGVNVLRAATGLDGACTDPAPCDVNGNGALTVTDGVNVLRAAAGLAVDLQCFDLE